MAILTKFRQFDKKKSNIEEYIYYKNTSRGNPIFGWLLPSEFVFAIFLAELIGTRSTEFFLPTH